jgi:hypothetical protein
MIVHDLDVSGAFVGPTEANPVLVVDPDAVLPCTLPFQSLQAIAWWAPKVKQAICSVQHVEPAPGHVLE